MRGHYTSAAAAGAKEVLATAGGRSQPYMLRDTCQIRVHLIEARQLKPTAGADLPNPVAKIHLKAGPIERMQTTRIHRETGSVYFDETKIFSEPMTRDEFQEGQLTVKIEDDRGFFSNGLIGEATLDLTTVHDSNGHEMFGK